MDKKMRVAILLNSRFPTEKAYGIQVLAMARGFAGADVEVAVVYPRRTTQQPAPEKGVEFVPFGGLMELKQSWMFSFFRTLGVFEAKTALRKWSPDIVLANDPLQAALLSKEFPIVWDLHDLPDTKTPGRGLLLRLITKFAKGIVSTNHLKIDALQNIVGNLPSEFYTVLQNPVSVSVETYRNISLEDARKKLRFSSDVFHVVYAGQLYQWKGVDTLVAAAQYLTSSVQIHIVGGMGEDLERCKGIAEQLGISSEKVIFHGQQSSVDIPYWLRAADLIAVPNSGKFEISVRDTNPMKLYEAIAAGTPILASNLPSIREASFGSESIIFVDNPDEPKAWAEHLEKLSSSPDTMRQLRESQHTQMLLTPGERAIRLRDFFLTCLNKPHSR